MLNNFDLSNLQPDKNEFRQINSLKELSYYQQIGTLHGVFFPNDDNALTILPCNFENIPYYWVGDMEPSGCVFKKGEKDYISLYDESLQSVQKNPKIAAVIDEEGTDKIIAILENACVVKIIDEKIHGLTVEECIEFVEGLWILRKYCDMRIKGAILKR